MALFGKLFGTKANNKDRLIRGLVRFRIDHDPSAPLMGVTSEMVDGLTDQQIMMLPEATIATIVETYVALVSNAVPNRVAIDRIDEFRSSSFGNRRAKNVDSIFDFVAERVRLEHQSTPPLDEAFIDVAVQVSAKVFGVDLTLPERDPYQVIDQFEISTFKVVIAKYTRRDGGYLYPWRLLAIDSRTEAFAFSYNLEVTPITCGLGSHTASGGHMSFGPGDPEMPLEDFVGWAVPLAIERIYGDQLLTEEEAHAFGVKIVADRLGSEGMQLQSIDLSRDPQIHAFKDGRPVEIIVRVAPFPNKGQIDEMSEEIATLSDACDECGHDLYFAGVGLANANARNDFERMALLRNGSFHVSFSGLDPLLWHE